MKVKKYLLWTSLILLISCMAHIKLQQRYDKIETDMRNLNFKSANANIDAFKNTYDAKDKVLYFLDKGIVSFYDENYTDAFNFLNNADKTMEELYTKSVSNAVLSFLTNDYELDYSGEDYESIYTNIFKSLSFTMQNNFESAHIEIRRLHEKLKKLSIDHQKEISKLKDSKEYNKENKIKFGDYTFSDSAFARYLSMILYRAEADDDDAEIDRRKLIEYWKLQKDIYNYPVPDKGTLRITLPKKDSSIVSIMAFLGQGPYKRSWELEAISEGKMIQIRSTSADKPFDMTYYTLDENNLTFKIAVPQIIERSNRIRTAKVYINGIYRKDLYPFENFGRVAINNFKSYETNIILKSLLRSLVKAITAENATKDMKKDENDILGGLMSYATKAAINSTEIADLRAWRLMPNEVHLTDITLPYGSHEIRIDFCDQNNQVIHSKIFQKTLTKEQKLNAVTTYAL